MKVSRHKLVVDDQQEARRCWNCACEWHSRPAGISDWQRKGGALQNVCEDFTESDALRSHATGSTLPQLSHTLYMVRLPVAGSG